MSDTTPSNRVEMHRIEGDIYINGVKKIFAVDFNKSSHPTYDDVDWLLGWAKIGLMSKRFDVPNFQPTTSFKGEPLTDSKTQ